MFWLSSVRKVPFGLRAVHLLPRSVGSNEEGNLKSPSWLALLQVRHPDSKLDSCWSLWESYLLLGDSFWGMVNKIVLVSRAIQRSRNWNNFLFYSLEWVFPLRRCNVVKTRAILPNQFSNTILALTILSSRGRGRRRYVRRSARQLRPRCSLACHSYWYAISMALKSSTN